MLERTLKTQYVPGSVLKGDVSGAAWTYLLPNLELESVVCIGKPEMRTLKTLARISREVVVLCTTTKEWDLAKQSIKLSPVENVQILRIAVPDILPFVSVSVDLIYLATRKAKKKFKSDVAFNRELQRILKPDGLIYYESHRLPRQPSETVNPKENGRLEWNSQCFLVSPPAGEVQSAVPINAFPVIQFFRRNLLDHPLMTLGLLKRLGRVLRNGRSPHHKVQLHPTRKSPSSGLRKPRLPVVLRNAGHRVILGLQNAERHLNQNRLLGRYLERYGVLVNPHSSRNCGDPSSTTESADFRNASEENGLCHPPRYLCNIAREAGLDLTHFQYGLSANGEFQSRKTLFFLFSENETKPSYVAKLSRDPNFNDRVERERDALKQLADLDHSIAGAVPRLAFFGYHNNLAILGQSAINGQPFVERTRATVDCPHARQAIDWIGELGTATTESSTQTPGETAEALEMLLERFLGLYRLDSRRRKFLTSQINKLRETSAVCPSVFLHGDPHSTNLMVTESGGIAFVDWEASDPRGMPLWDLLFFLRAYCMLVTRVRNSADQLKAFEKHFLRRSSLHTLILESVEGYCEKLDLPTDLIEPLFYTCWIHRALRESFQLSAEGLNQGHYFNLLKLCIDKHDAPMLQRLFAAGTTGTSRIVGISTN